MIHSRLFWNICMASAAAGWLFIAFGIFSDLRGLAYGLWVMVTLLWCLGHPLELIVSAPIAKRAGYTAETALLNTLVFGLTWWIPVKLGVFKR